MTQSDEIITQVCVKHEVVTQALWSKRGMKGTVELTEVRREIAQKLRALGWSLKRIGLKLGVHHTTVLYYLRKAKQNEAETSQT
jgi:chromosomal replication initiation ATPase DnaA